MLYCDLTVDGTVKWSGVPCLNGVDLNSFIYLDFIGSLVFVDTMGKTNPNYTGLADRYVLLYIVSGQDNVQIPLQAIPSQQLAIVLNDQNCVMSFYERDAEEDAVSYVLINAPVSGIISSTFIASAYPPMASYQWSITNGIILSGQGTQQIEYQASSVGPVTITLDAGLPQGGVTQAQAVTIIYDTSSFLITAPEYVWAGQFDVPVAVPYNGPYFNWSVSGAVRVSGSPTSGYTTVNMGRASQPASISAVISGLAISTWTFKVVPYTSAQPIALTLAGGETQMVMPDLGWAWDLVSVQANSPCWVRIYNTEADLIADAGRVIGDDPTTAIVWEGIFVSPGTVQADPGVSGVNGDTPRGKLSYVSITNTGVSPVSLTVTITRTETQVNGNF